LFSEGYDGKTPKCLGGDKGLTKSINILVNLANPAHYDTNEDSIGIGFGLRKTNISVQTFICSA